MKKILSFILVLAMCFALCSCANNAESEEPTLEPSTSSDNGESPVSGVTWHPLTEFSYNLFVGNLAITDFTTNSDGSFSEMFSTGEWSQNGNKLIKTFSDTSISYEYTLKTIGDKTFLIGKESVYSPVHLEELQTETIELTLDNWTDFFEIKSVSKNIETTDQFGDVIETHTNEATLIALKEEYATRCLTQQSEFLFRYNGADGSASEFFTDDIYYPLFASSIEFNGTDISDIYMDKIKGTLTLIAE